MLQPCGGAHQDNSGDDKGRANNKTEVQLLLQQADPERYPKNWREKGKHSEL